MFKEKISAFAIPKIMPFKYYMQNNEKGSRLNRNGFFYSKKEEIKRLKWTYLYAYDTKRVMINNTLRYYLHISVSLDFEY